MSTYWGINSPDFNWSALNDANQLLIDTVPKFKLGSPFNVLVSIVTVLSAFKVFESYETFSSILSELWAILGLIGAGYFALFIGSILVTIYRQRMILRRTGKVLKYPIHL